MSLKKLFIFFMNLSRLLCMQKRNAFLLTTAFLCSKLFLSFFDCTMFEKENFNQEIFLRFHFKWNLCSKFHWLLWVSWKIIINWLRFSVFENFPFAKFSLIQSAKVFQMYSVRNFLQLITNSHNTSKNKILKCHLVTSNSINTRLF